MITDMGFMSVSQYKAAKKRRWRKKFFPTAGKIIAKYCREKGYPIRQVYDEKYGKLNAYPVLAWDELTERSGWWKEETHDK